MYNSIMLLLSPTSDLSPTYSAARAVACMVVVSRRREISISSAFLQLSRSAPWTAVRNVKGEPSGLTLREAALLADAR
jgi:hypothetical protein